jgi:WD40 repeat protein/serine/threonine protein kinase
MGEHDTTGPVPPTGQETLAFRCELCGCTLPPYSGKICAKCESERQAVSFSQRRPGDLVGNQYRLIRLIDKGGMGEVWLAIEDQSWERSLLQAPSPALLASVRDEPARLEAELRKLDAAVDKVRLRSPGLLYAIKFTKLRMADGRVLERFLDERRMLSRLRDPHIAQVKDSRLTEDGEPFLVMEFVDGEEITAYCDRRKLSVSQRLDLFLDVCRGVRHANERGIVHRDLKPKNILVTEVDYRLVPKKEAPAASGNADAGSEPEMIKADGRPVPKLIDFGVAGEEETERENWMRGGDDGAFAGTMIYASPEQLRGERTDARTDVYALGVILYELLVGQTPVGLDEVRTMLTEARQEVVQRLAAIEIPPPEKRFSSTDLADRRKIAEWRASSIGLLTKQLRSELNDIVSKALERDPDARMASVSELMQNVRDYLDDRVVLVHPRSRKWSYCAAKFLRRNARIVSFGAAVLVTLVVAAIVSLSQAETAKKERNRAEFALRDKQATLEKASYRNFDAARERFDAGGWREGVTLIGQALDFWSGNQKAADYLVNALVYGQGDMDKMPRFGVRASKAISWVDFAPDGSRFVTGSYDGSAQIWDAATGRPIGGALHHNRAICCVRFSPNDNGKKVIATSEDGFAFILDALTGAQLCKPLDHGGHDASFGTSNVETGEFSPDGSMVLTACWDGCARLWRADTGEEIAKFQHHGRVACARFNWDGTRFVTACSDKTSQVWDIATRAPIGKPMQQGNTVRRALFTPDGRNVVTGSIDGTARIWKSETGAPICPPLQHGDAVWELAVSPDGKLLATASRDQTARLWEISTGKPVGRPLRHDGPVVTVAFSPDSSLLLTTSGNGKVRVWRVSDGELSGQVMRHDNGVLGAIFSPDGKSVLSHGSDNAAYLWDASPLPPPGELLPVAAKCRCVECTGDADRILLVLDDGTARFWSLGRNAFVGPAFKHGAPINAAAACSGAPFVITAGADGTANVWDAASGHPRGHTRTHAGEINALALKPDGTTFFTGGADGVAEEWRLPDCELVADPFTFPERRDIYSLAVSPSGRELAVGGRYWFIQFWNLQSRAMLPREIRLEEAFLALAYSPDGSRLVTASGDRSVKAWTLGDIPVSGPPLSLKGKPACLRSAPQGARLAIAGPEDSHVYCFDTTLTSQTCVPLAHPTGVRHLAINGDGSQIFTVDVDGKVRVWRLESAPAPPPQWFADYLRATTGFEYSDEQKLVAVTMRQRVELRDALLAAHRGDSAWEKLLIWTFTRSSTGAADPWMAPRE